MTEGNWKTCRLSSPIIAWHLFLSGQRYIKCKMWGQTSHQPYVDRLPRWERLVAGPPEAQRY
jgi:hypothetical protein